MPGQLACPGGALEPADRPGEPGAHARCASRELAEESGIKIAPEDWIAAGERITPPLFPQRFRTRFFLARLPATVAAEALRPASGENESLLLARPDELLGQWERGAAELPPPVLAILRALAEVKDLSPEQAAPRVAAENAREERAPRIEFAPGVWVLPVRTATLPPATHTNVWLPGLRHFVLIDPGSTEVEELRRLGDVVERRRALGHRPAAVLLTHHHGDHAAGARLVCERFGLPLAAHRETLDALGALAAGLDGRPLADGETVELEGLTLRALHTPGHARGHLAFHVAERGWLFAGDLASGLSTILIDPADGDMDAYLTSLARVEALGCRLLFPGHGPPLAAHRIGALIAHRIERERRIAAALAPEDASLADLAAVAYADGPGLPAPLVARQTLAHLLRLERQGRAERADPQATQWRLTRRGRTVPD